MRNITQAFLLSGLAIVFITILTACPAKQPQVQTPEPVDDKPLEQIGDANVETEDVKTEEPQSEVPQTDEPQADNPLNVTVRFFDAMSDGDWDEAETYCTGEFWGEYFEEEISSAKSGAALQMLRDDFTLSAEDEAELHAATWEINGDTAILTVSPDNDDTIIHFVLVDGEWKMNEWDW